MFATKEQLLAENPQDPPLPLQPVADPEEGEVADVVAMPAFAKAKRDETWAATLEELQLNKFTRILATDKALLENVLPHGLTMIFRPLYAIALREFGGLRFSLTKGTVQRAAKAFKVPRQLINQSSKDVGLLHELVKARAARLERACGLEGVDAAAVTAAMPSNEMSFFVQRAILMEDSEILSIMPGVKAVVAPFFPPVTPLGFEEDNQAGSSSMVSEKQHHLLISNTTPPASTSSPSSRPTVPPQAALPERDASSLSL